MLAKLGDYTINERTSLIDDKWQYQTPKMGMWSNWLRRIPVIYYPLAKAPPALVDAYAQAVQAIDQAPFRSQLAPLDNDPDLSYYGASSAGAALPISSPAFPTCVRPTAA